MDIKVFNRKVSALQDATEQEIANAMLSKGIAAINFEAADYAISIDKSHATADINGEPTYDYISMVRVMPPSEESTKPYLLVYIQMGFDENVPIIRVGDEENLKYFSDEEEPYGITELYDPLDALAELYVSVAEVLENLDD